jgi:CRP/FNR family transcriptional regulator, anaerobic regulatory protein
MNDDAWIERFEGLRRLPDEIKETLVKRSQVVTVPGGTKVFGPGLEPDNLLLLIEGTVKVSQTSESGREIVLYRVEAGQSCVLTTACLLAHEAYSAEGVAETAVTAVAIPRAVFDNLAAVPQFRLCSLRAPHHGPVSCDRRGGLRQDRRAAGGPPYRACGWLR